MRRLLFIVGTAMLHRRSLIPAFGLMCAAGLVAGVATGNILLAADRPATPPSSGTPPSSPLPPGNTIVARVDGTELHLSDVRAGQQNLPPQPQKLPLEPITPIPVSRLAARP